MGMFDRKKVLVLGVANDRSLAWGMAEELYRDGAPLAFTHLKEVLERRIRPLTEGIGCHNVYPRDVQSDEQLDAPFARIQDDWGTLDGEWPARSSTSIAASA